MPRNQTKQTTGAGRAIQKFLLSGFVVFSFVAYVIHERFTYPDSPLNATPTAIAQSITPQAEAGFSGQAIDNTAVPTNSPSAPQQQPPTPAPIQTGQYRDGVYTGPQVDAYYGIVEVQVTVQNGNIADIQFLKYPNDRRTSVRINRIAMPYLQQEAIQVQSARVNIISGATFTSEGFAMSLNAALKSAQN